MDYVSRNYVINPASIKYWVGVSVFVAWNNAQKNFDEKSSRILGAPPTSISSFVRTQGGNLSCAFNITRPNRSELLS